ncbi:enoyl-CoA hydratase [Vreelandella nanhaiensis]|uniref:Enoyl-CoA hydratase n=1 Tax=Vreelandella nanhaiensis TaxID=1258546 RepID=A0A3S0XX67_9GAMM|nr:enoyl-CoA hydratase [Halomonas nanhaiensis]RUR32270.1 enoyl-CoA hydratase [Halomonas nanhaiensis]
MQQENQPGYIKSELDGSTLRITICNSRRYNAMSLAMWQDLGRVVNEAQTNDDVRLIVLSGEGNKAFMSGADITEFKDKRNDREQAQFYADSVNLAQSSLRSSQKPTVAVVKGICMGGGMGLALSCDLRYCTESARFRMPAGKLGLGYALDGIKRFVDVMGAARTYELFLTARILNGTEAARIGLVNQSFADDLFDHAVESRIADIAGHAPLTMQSVKNGVRCLLQEDNAPTPEQVAEMVIACFESEDYKEGRQAFKEKRQPVFTGR